MLLQRYLNPRKLVIEVPHRISLDTHLTVRVPIAHKLEHIVCPVVQLVVLPPHIFQQLEEVQSAAGIDRRDGAMGFAVLEP
jgi:hypothetical protein